MNTQTYIAFGVIIKIDSLNSSVGVHLNIYITLLGNIEGHFDVHLCNRCC